MTQAASKKIMIMAGGTGGHIFPGLAVAAQFKKQGWEVVWLGSKGGMEETLVGQSEIPLQLITVKGLRGNGLIGWLKLPLSLTHSIFQSLKIISRENPDMVIGFGGFVTGPGGLAAKLKGLPLVIHEQNAVAGMTNRYLGKLSARIFQAFPGAFKKSEKVETVGNPIREEIVALAEFNSPQKTADEVLNLLVIGGSRGALALNKFLPQLLSEMINNQKINVTHQVGKSRVDETQGFYKSAGVTTSQNLHLVEFIEDMASAYKSADIIVCRAGALTVSEVAAVGRAAVFVPYPYAVDDHQTVNANWLVKNHAAICFQERELLDLKTKEAINALLNQPNEVFQMGINAKHCAQLNAATKIVDYCVRLRGKAA